MKLSALKRGIVAGFAAVSLVLTGCGGTGKSATSSASSTTESKEATGPFEIKDTTDRTVKFDKAPQRIIFGESRGIFATSILNPKNPTDKIVAWGTDLKGNVNDYYTNVIKVMPKVKEVPEIGGFRKADVTVENLVSYKPDVIILSVDEYKGAQKSGMLQNMDNAGLKYVVIDFRAKPLTNTTKSMTILGQLFGKQKEAEDFNKEWNKTVKMIEERVAKVKTKPTVYVWRSAGVTDCCGTWNNSNISELVNKAGGKNIGDEFIKGESGSLTPEQVIAKNPDQIIVTGGDWTGKKNKAGNPAAFASAGYNIDQKTAQESMKTALAAQPGFETLDAPKKGNFHVIWHQFYNSPLNYIAMLQIAKWLHPEEFKDIDIKNVWTSAHDKWVPIKGDGAFFNTLETKQDKQAK
ncbi:ABC transporter substrate-binding protein [Actinotignum urinale]|uniref:ABC transporter substrate-binding protein n=1 Tax=Actinotignum urinale TaxID=190146 RepID=A0AAW9HK90_9ACTO|nr:ABC transporter substrate-binding protein [Actinotignum urinale]MDY5154326.1 ABC transporter substrate-binding protein [Actinotignum urinale]